jgi:arylsulfatase A-like enzyme
METFDSEVLDYTLKFLDKNGKGDKPFFVWFNTTRMHIFTHLKPESQGKTGLGVYPDGMAETDGHVGVLLKKLDDLKIADNTLVIYTTDNGLPGKRCRACRRTPAIPAPSLAAARLSRRLHAASLRSFPHQDAR